MILHSLKLSGIIPYRNPVEVQFDALGRIVAINGANGVGKSTLIECISLALNNLLPSRMMGKDAGTIYDVIYPNMLSYVELIFTTKGKKYRIVRNYTFGVTFNGKEQKKSHGDQTAFIYEWIGIGVDPINAKEGWLPKAQQERNVNDYINDNLIPQNLFFASAFNSQDSAGDLVDSSVSDRKKLFASMLNLDHLTARANMFSERTKLIETMIEKENNNMRIKESHIVNVDEVNVEIEAKEYTLAGVESGIVTITAARDLIMTNKSKADAVSGQVDEKKNQLKALEVKLYNLKKDRDTRQSKINNEQTYRNQIAQIDVLKLEVGALEDKLKDKDEINNAVKLENNGLQVLTENARKCERKYDEIIKGMTTRLNEAREVLASEQSKKSDYQYHESNVKLLEGLDCPQNCTYVKNAVESKDIIKNIEISVLLESINIAQQNVFAIEKELHGMAEYIDTPEYRNYYNSGNAIRGKIDELEKKLLVFYDYRNAINKKRDKIQSLELSKPSESLALMDEHHKRIDELKAEISTTETDISVLNDEIQTILTGAVMDNYEDMLMTNGAEKQRLELQRQSLADSIAVLRGKLMESAKAQLHKSMIEGKINKLRALAARYNRLSFAFGLKGIQALVIDSEKHQFLSIAKELFDILSDGKMQLQFETIKQNKDKSLKEDFNLFVVIEGQRIEVKFLSGAQKSMAKLIMRATLNIFNGQKNQGTIDTLILDEITGAYTAENRERFFTLLNYMSKFFHQVLLITHQDVAERIPCRILINEKRELEIG